jgi:hypothetical protein
MSLSDTPGTAFARACAIRRTLFIGLLILTPLAGVALNPLLGAQQKPTGDPPGQYDEAKVPPYTLPDALLLLNGKKVTSARTWTKKRRSEILKLFETNVYGQTMAGRPKAMTWEVTTNGTSPVPGLSAKTVTIYFAGNKEEADKNAPKMVLQILLPANAKKPIPVFLMPTTSHRIPRQVLDRGYGFVSFDPTSIEPDNANGYAKSVRAFFAPPKQKEPGPDEWGAIGAWAWAMSRAMDYLVTDPDIDGKRVSIVGISRYGKVTMWAGAQDERFAIVFSGESGCGGANLVRRQFGETVKSITATFPYWFDGNFKTYGDRVNDLPVDWHMLIALMAPRSVYIATAEQDHWGDPRGSFLAAKAAEPVYKLFGKAGLGGDDMPAVATPVGDWIGFHNRRGTHGIDEYDWAQFLNFADRHFGISRPPK